MATTSNKSNSSNSDAPTTERTAETIQALLDRITEQATEAETRIRKAAQEAEGGLRLGAFSLDGSLAYTDAAVLDIGRRHGTQLPDALADELAKLGVGGITKPRVVDGGVQMLAICSKDVARDLTFLKSELRQETGTELVQKEADAYLTKLRSEARIVYPR